MKEDIGKAMTGRDLLETAAELFDWLAFASVLAVIWLVNGRWGFAASALAGMGYGGAVILGVGYLRTHLRLRSAGRAGAQPTIATVSPSEASDAAVMRALFWFAVVLSFVISAGYWLDATMNDGLFRSSYVIMGSILALLWGSIGLFRLIRGGPVA